MTAKNKVDAKSITSDQLEEMFDDGDDILDYVDLDNPVVEHHPPLEKRITLTMPAWMVSELDEEAADLAISRNAVVNTWIADRLRTSPQTPFFSFTPSPNLSSAIAAANPASAQAAQAIPCDTLS